jgi:DNA-binding response OmpR family regulator
VSEFSSTRPLLFVLEDEIDISRLIRLHLEQAGYGVREYQTVTNVLRDGVASRPALFLLDIMVPGGDGFDLCRRIRQNSLLASTPLIFLTARTSEADRVLGLELGADDYITKPFSPRELVARVRAVLRRFDSPLAPSVTRVGDLEIDTGAMILIVRTQHVPTTATEFRLLDWFVRHPGRVFTRDQLLDVVWRDTQYVTPRSVDVYVRRLREKIESDPENPRYIRTVRGAGYRFETPGPFTPEPQPSSP